MTKKKIISENVSVSESILPAMSMDTLIVTLANPKSHISTSQQLEIRIAARRAELEQLEIARQILESPEITEVVNQDLCTTQKTIDNSNHVVAILRTLKGEKNGLMINDISQKLIAINHIMSQKSLASYLWSMTRSGKLLREGERGSFRYKSVI